MQSTMTRHCAICGRKIPGNLSVHELMERGAASHRGTDGQIIFHCIQRHSKDQIEQAELYVPVFRRASEPE